ncbi:MAG TPA: preprotein translocase subunit YajC [Polyangia bacterium]|nr:preprotein translocase subunit YajC [Polyangia bacterium]
MSGSFIIGLADAPAAAQAPAAPAATGAQQAQPAGPPPNPFGCGGAGGNFTIPLALIFMVFYFMLIRPQQKQQKELTNWLKGLKKGDEVVTSGGVIGKITGLDEQVVTLEVQEKVRLKVLRSNITGKPPTTGPKATSSSSTTSTAETSK